MHAVPAPTRPASDTAEARRLAALAALGLAEGRDAALRATLGPLLEAAALLLEVPVCVVSVIDAQGQRVLGAHGAAFEQLPHAHSLCASAVADDADLHLPDAAADPRFATHPEVQAGFGVRFYAGMLLRDEQGTALGTVCAIDRQPRAALAEHQQQALRRLADVVQHLLAERRRTQAALAERELLQAGPGAAVVWAAEPGWPLVYRSANLATVLGEAVAARLADGATWEQVVDPRDRADVVLALQGHVRTPLRRLELTYRVGGPDGWRWVRQTSHSESGDAARTRVRGYLSDETRHKQIESSLAVARERLMLAAESARLGTFDLRYDSGERLLDSRTGELVGLRPEELETHIEFWNSRIHPLDLSRVQAKIDALHAERERTTVSLQYRVRHRDGHYLWLQSHAKVVLRRDDGRVQRLVGTLMDVTERRREETARNQQRQLLDVLNRAQAGFLLNRDMHEACEGLFQPLLALTDSQFGFIGIVREGGAGRPYLLVPAISDLSWNAATQQLVERHRDRRQALEFHSLDNLFGHAVTSGEVVISNAPASHPASRGLPPGHPPLASFLGLPIRFRGRVLGMIGLGNRDDGYDAELVQLLEPLVATLGALIHARDLESAREQAELELQRRAHTDELTGLPNRRRFVEQAEAALARARRSGQPLVLALIDLDHFKRVNDTHGHAAGDAVLAAFASAAGTGLREVDLLARQGGEEFALLLHDTDAEAAAAPLERLRAAVEALQVPVGDSTLRVTCSIGAVVCKAGAPGLDRALALADEALYAAKGAGRNTVCWAGAALELAA